MAVLVTGAAGFIGSYVCRALLERGEKVVGVDNLNDYYEVSLKKARLENLKDKNFTFIIADIANNAELGKALQPYLSEIKFIVHLAGYAGVRHSILHPFLYAEANIIGHLAILEIFRKAANFKHMVYASSSSVYGLDIKTPFSLNEKADSPISLYGATKRCDEILSASYANLYGLQLTGLRFFTVYGPWGRPDMAYYSFTKAIFAGQPIQVYNNGNMQRDFTWIDDIVSGILGALYKLEKSGHRYYNLGNNKPEQLMDVITILERAIGKKAVINFAPTPPGDVFITYSDISQSQKDFGYSPKVSIKEGLPKFVEWFKKYYKI